MSSVTYDSRSKTHPTTVGRALLEVMSTKKSNLAFSADIHDTDSFLAMCDAVGPYICILKTHIDTISDFGPRTTDGLTALAEKHNFMVFEDRKFGDIGSTVQYQYRDGPLHIIKWAHIVNAHIVAGKGIVDGLEEVAREHMSPTGRGLLLLAEMSSEGTLATGEYSQRALEMARMHKQFVMGFIANGSLPNQRWSDDEDFLIFTAGINSGRRDNVLGQRYQTPEEAISRGADIIIVGRGIYGAKDPVNAAKEYRKEGWEAYEKRLQTQRHAKQVGSEFE